MELCIQLSIIMLGKQLIQNNIFEIGVPYVMTSSPPTCRQGLAPHGQTSSRTFRPLLSESPVLYSSVPWPVIFLMRQGPSHKACLLI